MARGRNGRTTFWQDFIAFINRGNVVDLAVAVVIGGAFAKIVEAVVELITTALLNPTMERLGVNRIQEWPAGNLLVAIINFIVIALVVYFIIRALEKMKFKQSAAEAGPDPVAVQQDLAQAVNRLSNALESRQL